MGEQGEVRQVGGAPRQLVSPGGLERGVGDRGGLTKSMVQERGYLLQLRLCRAGVEVEACGFS